MNAKLVKHLFFPFHERVKAKNTLSCLQKLESTQWWGKDELYAFRLRKLKLFLQYAYDCSSYYYRLFNNSGFIPSQVKDFDDLKKIPFLTKEIIRKNLDNLKSKSYQGRMQLASTGGSTGEPVAVYWDMNRLSWDTAAQLRCHKWFDIDIGEKEAVIWGSPIEITKQDRIRSLRDHFINTRLLSAFNLSEQSLESYLKILRKWNPSKIYGYASVIYTFAKYLLSHNIAFPVKSLKAIFPTAEPLYDFQREEIQKAFGCPVSIEYGSRDAGAIAHECPEGGLHVNAENIIIEVLSNENKVSEGGSGEIVVTNMSTIGMPLIRYKTGDIGTISTNNCSCGRFLPLLGEVEGRSTDFLVGHDGRLIHALSIIYILRERKKIKQFRVIQESTKSVIIEVVVYSKLTDKEVFDIKRQIRNLLKSNVEIKVNYLDNIKTLASGKHRYVISRVTPELLKNARAR